MDGFAKTFYSLWAGEKEAGFPGLEEDSVPEPAPALPQDHCWGGHRLAFEESPWGEAPAHPEPPPSGPASGQCWGGSVLISLPVPFRPGAPKEEQSLRGR